MFWCFLFFNWLVTLQRPLLYKTLWFKIKFTSILKKKKPTICAANRSHERSLYICVYILSLHHLYLYTYVHIEGYIDIHDYPIYVSPKYIKDLGFVLLTQLLEWRSQSKWVILWCWLLSEYCLLSWSGPAKKGLE